MKERPIIMQSHSVKAILAGTKTQTRRLVKPEPGIVHIEFAGVPPCVNKSFAAWSDVAGTKHYIECPKGKPGDRLWVRESYRLRGWSNDDGEVLVEYRDRVISEWIEAGDDGETWIDNATRNLPAGYEEDARLMPWRNSLFMPRALSRLTLEITGVNVDRLKSISEADAIAEGYAGDLPLPRFSEAWGRINGKKPGASWDENPWVWCISFKAVWGGAE